MKSNKENYIKYILDFLRKGGTERKDIMSVFCSKFQLTTRTFDSYWVEAQKRYQETIQASINAVVNGSQEATKEAVKFDILTKFEGMEIATKIARGIVRKVEGQFVIPSDAERIKALDYLSKMQGWIESDKESPVTIHLNFDEYELVSDEIKS